MGEEPVLCVCILSVGKKGTRRCDCVVLVCLFICVSAGDWV